MEIQTDVRRKMLTEFLQTRRARLSPAEVGLPSNGRRRTPGLRREEVAQLAGVGLTWYTWLEQGRDISVSDAVLESIARALQLNPYETRHLFTLAQPQPTTFSADEYVSPAIKGLLAHQGLFPAFVLGRYWDILAWNPAASWLLGGLEQLVPAERNQLRLMFNNTAIRSYLCDWENHAQRMIAEFRVSFGRYIEDTHFGALVDDLNATSDLFREWWPRHDVVGRQNVFKTFDLPEYGRLVFEETKLIVSEAPDLRIVVKIPLASTDTLDKLQVFVARMTPKTGTVSP